MLVLVALIHQKRQTLNIFNEEVVDIRVCEVQRDIYIYIQVRKHSSSLYVLHSRVALSIGVVIREPLGPHSALTICVVG